MFVSDTNIVSIGAPGQAARHPELVTWLERNSSVLFLSVVTLAEIKAARQGASAKAVSLRVWLDRVLRLYRGRILTVDTAVARAAGGLTDVSLKQGLRPDFADVLIAATAMVHGHTVLTRNLRHFVPMRVPALDPFAALPPT